MKQMRLPALLLSAALLLGLAAPPGLAAGRPTWAELADTAWYGADEAAAEYVLSTPQQLAGLALLVNSGIETFEDRVVRLAADLDLSGREWIPIGGNEYGERFRDDETTRDPFQGRFDGLGHAVRGLEVTRGGYAGLFGYVQGGEVRSLSVEGSVAGELFAGGVAAFAGGGALLAGCVSHVTVRAGKAGEDSPSWAGGIVGCLPEGRINGCASRGSVSALTEAGYAGGVAGYVADRRQLDEDCVSTGWVSAGPNRTGSLIGLAGEEFSQLKEEPAAAGPSLEARDYADALELMPEARWGSITLPGESPARLPAELAEAQRRYAVELRVTGWSAYDYVIPWWAAPVPEAGRLFYHLDELEEFKVPAVRD